MNKIEKQFLAYTKYIKSIIKALDAQMELPSTIERGRNIAKILNEAELTTDKIRRFTLGVKTFK